MFLRKLHNAAQGDNIELQYQIHPYQHIRTHNPPALKEASFDADYALCMYPNIESVGPELAYLLYERRNSFRHVFIVTRGYTPDDDEIKKGIHILPGATIKRDSGIFETLPLKGNSEDGYDAEAQSMMSYWHVHSIRNEQSRKQLLSILMYT